MPLIKKAAPKGKKKSLSFSVDCSAPVDDRIMDIALFEKFLSEKIKVSGKAGAQARHLLASFPAHAFHRSANWIVFERVECVQATWGTLLRSVGTSPRLR
jgi:hypothetical protein